MSRLSKMINVPERFLAAWLILSCFSAGIARGQAVSQISGTVKDNSGAVVPDVQVTATQTDTDLKRTVTTDAAGNFVLTNLPIGPYRLEASKMAFRTYVQTGIELQVNTRPEIAITLSVGQVSESVQVEANAAQVETRSMGVGTVVETQRVLDLPLNGRLPQDLIALSGAAVQTGASPPFGMNTGYSIAVAGGDTFGVQYDLDGANYVNYFDGTGLILPFPDALQEFKISTSTQDASSLGKSGAVVNAVMKSGTNAFHGDAFEFIRNYDMNARDFFAKARDGLKRNQFGGTLGGPIKKNTLFFFLGYQGTFVRQTPIATTTFVPTAAEELGNFQAYASPACQGHQVNLATRLSITWSPCRRLSPAALKIAALLPTPQDQCGTFLTGNPLSENEHQADVRGDYQVNQYHSLFAHYLLDKQLIVNPYSLAPNNVLTASAPGANDQFNTLTLGDTYLFGADKVNAARVYLSRITANIPPIKMFGPSQVGVNAYTYTPNYLTLLLTGAFSLGNASTSEDSFDYVTDFGVTDDFTWVRGSHQFGFGGNLTRSIDWSIANAFSGPYMSVTGTATGLAMADFLLGDVASLKQTPPNPLNVTQNFLTLYASDVWKITSRLTMTYGVAWNPYFGQNFKQGQTLNFSLSSFYAGTTSQVVRVSPPGFTFPGDAGFPGKSGMNAQYGHVDPRLGFAWDPLGDGKTSIRASAGQAHDFFYQEVNLSTSTELPYFLLVQNSNVSLDNPFPQGDPFPYSYNPKNPVWPTASTTAACLASSCPPTFVPIPRNLHTQEQYTWNLGYSGRFCRLWFLSGDLPGLAVSIHVWDAVEFNPAIYVAGNCNAGQYGLTAPGPCTNATTVNITDRRVLNLAHPNAAPMGDITSYDDGGTQSYNGLLVTTNYRLRNGLNLNANYTWSHCIGMPTLGVLNPGGNYADQGYGQNVYPDDQSNKFGNCCRRPPADHEYYNRLPDSEIFESHPPSSRIGLDHGFDRRGAQRRSAQYSNETLIPIRLSDPETITEAPCGQISCYRISIHLRRAHPAALRVLSVNNG